jgi:transposase InsO family protein
VAVPEQIALNLALTEEISTGSVSAEEQAEAFDWVGQKRLENTRRRPIRITRCQSRPTCLLEWCFDVAAPNTAWVSDITYLWTRQGWLYLAVIIDLYSRKVVGWSLRERMTADLVCDALDAAVRARRPPPGLVFHSDRGSQYASKTFRRRLFRYRMKQSMSRKGNCWDNAVAESFFATLKKELVRNHVFPTRDAARSDVFEYIEAFYNRRRAHSLLGYETPTSFEACAVKSESA